MGNSPRYTIYTAYRPTGRHYLALFEGREMIGQATPRNAREVAHAIMHWFCETAMCWPCALGLMAQAAAEINQHNERRAGSVRGSIVIEVGIGHFVAVHAVIQKEVRR